MMKPPSTLWMLELMVFYCVVSISVQAQNSFLSVKKGITNPEFTVEPQQVQVFVDPNGQATAELLITNNAQDVVFWSVEIGAFNPVMPTDTLIAQFQYPLSDPPGGKGIECDGEYFYVTSLSGGISKYALDGTFIETLSGVSSMYDLAYNGAYFYSGGPGNTVVEMDFNAQTIVNTFSVPQPVRAIAYNHLEDIIYSWSWGNNIVAFDLSGANLGSAPVGPLALSYQGLSFDPVSPGGPFLWGYGADENNQNILVQMSLPDMIETGVVYYLDELLPEPLINGAGGLYTHPEIVPGTWTLGGVVSDEWIWGLQLPQEGSWLSCPTSTGMLSAGGSETIWVEFDATGLIPWCYEAEIQFTTSPDVGSPVVEVLMEVTGGPDPPSNLTASYECTDVFLNWELNTLYYPPVSFNVYRNGALWINVPDTFCTDSLILPETTYQFAVSAVFTCGESMVTFSDPVQVPVPDDLIPTNFQADIIDSTVNFSWSVNGCLEPDSFKVYLNGEVFSVVEPPSQIILEPGSYECYVTAVYYFGESEPSNTVTFLLTDRASYTEESIEIFPVPASERLYIRSPYSIEKLILSDMTGKEALHSLSPGRDVLIKLDFLQPGIYFLILETKKETVYNKIILR